MPPYRDGDTRNIQGVTYVRRGGSWSPQGGGTAPQPLIQPQPAPVRPVQEELDALRLRRETREFQVEEGVDVPGDVNLEGEAYLHSLPQSMQSQVRALSEGRLAMPQGRAAAAPYWQRIMQATGHYDPSFDAANYQTRVSTRRNFTSGLARRNITSLNTALGHLDTLSQRATELNNTDWPIVNTVRNFARRQSGDPRIDRFNQTRQAVVDELERAFRGSAGSVTGIEHWRENINTAQSPQQLQGAIQEAIELLGSRLEALGAEYNAGMGRSDDPVSLLTPHAQQIMHSLGGAGYGGNDQGPIAPPTLGGPSGGGRVAPGVTTGPGGVETTNVSMMNATPGRFETSQGEHVEEPDPTLAGVNRRVGTMIANGTPDEDIRSYIRSVGVPMETLNDPQNGLEAVLRFRRTPDFREWKRQNPNAAYQVDLERHLTERGPVRAVLGAAGDTGPGAAAISAGNMVLGQRLPEIIGATGGNEELARAGIEEVRSRHPVSSLVGDIGGGALTFEAGRGLMGRLPGTVTSRLPAVNTATFGGRAIAGDVALGAYEGSGMDPEHPVSGGVRGALLGFGGGVGGRGAINSTARALSPTGGRLAEAYAEGVQPTIGQRMGGFPNRLEQHFEDIPVIGEVQRGARQSARDQWELGGFNQALRNLPEESGGPVQLPSGVQPGTAPHRLSQRAFDRAYNRVHRRINVQDDAELQADLATLQSSAGLLADPSISWFNRVLDNSVRRRIDNGGGTLSGPELQQAMSEIRRTARNIRRNPSGDRDLADAFDELGEALHANASRHSPPEAIGELNNINRGYAMLTRIENAANRAGTQGAGRYSARGLLNAERREGGLRGRAFARGDGLLTDYAESGLRLGETVPNSGSPARGITMAATMGAGAHWGHPLFAVPWLANTAANLPVFRQTLNAALAPNRPALAGFRKQIEDRARYGSLAGVPLALDLYGQ